MAKKRSNAAAPFSPSPPTTTSIAPANGSSTPPLPPPAIVLPTPEPGAVVKINKLNLSEVKGAFDEAIKKLLTSPPQSYTQSHRHQDVKLALGWSSCLIALGTVGWSTRVEWEESKRPLTIAVALYLILSTIQWIYSTYVEKDSIFVGRRKALVDGRIETSNISIAAKTSLPKPARVPIYTITLSSSRSTNAGKSLLARVSLSSSRPIGEFVDASGVVDLRGIEDWVEGLVDQGNTNGEVGGSKSD
ncbi:microsomal signal peptidase 25 kDa subunit-domain-containing protein [Mrakia frigida]|uniref:signal peptidase complex subunit SPC2 n=1 Tax=Mrakia frigida TaxID=29902 RepID=UPI003FCC2686